MEEIQVGDWIRDREGNITKIIQTLSLFKDVELYLGEDGYQYSDNAIVKHSSNIIDLIEIGDILKLKNGEKWEVQEHQGNGNWLQLEWENIDDNKDFFKKVDSIITKERFEENSYKVGD